MKIELLGEQKTQTSLLERIAQAVEGRQSVSDTVRNVQNGRTNYQKRSYQLEKAVKFLKDNPDKINLSARQLAVEIGVSKTTAHSAMREVLERKINHE